ncbi:MAG: Sec-independent protein translocase protein TatB [Rubrivivax sp.]|jgi:sec-independent protein translocase protein TatB|nr:Sec-independent protein translocase protein TatB [Rubrivivax sp.]
MIDFGFDKLALIGAVALIVIGPEKLPKVARTVGHLFGKAQRYVSDVKAEVNRSIELDELKKMKSDFESAARDVEQTVHQEVNAASSAFEKDWADATSSLGSSPLAEPPGAAYSDTPTYQHPGKKWRLKRGAVPQWYKQRHGVRSKAQSAAARVARFRPPGQKAPR